MKPTAADLERAARAWAQLERALGPISAAHTDSNALRMMSLLDSLVDAGRAQPSPNWAGLLAFVTEWVQAYDASTTQIPATDPVALLRHLMKENGLRQADLAAELGGQSVVSAILRGKRQISGRQARALGLRFALSPAVFIGGEPTDLSTTEGLQSEWTAGPVKQLAVHDAVAHAGATPGTIYEFPYPTSH